jgi:hypothetical protein
VLTFGSYVVDAYDSLSGAPAWRLPGFGTSPVASPVIEGDLAFVVVPDQAAEFSTPPAASFAPLDTDGDGALTPQEIESSDWASTFPWFDVDGDGKAALTEIARQLEVMASPDFSAWSRSISPRPVDRASSGASARPCPTSRRRSFVRASSSW